MGGQSPADQALHSANESLLKAIQKAEGDYVTEANNTMVQVNAGYTQAMGSIRDYFGQALQAGQPWASGGLTAVNTMAANLADPAQGTANFMASTPYQMMMGGYGVSPNNMPTTLQQSQSAFENSPEYKFTLQQGLAGATRAQAIQGNIDDPSLAYQLQTTGSGIASQQEQNYLANLNTAYGQYNTNLTNLAGVGETAMQGNQQLLGSEGQDIAQLSAGLGTASGQIFQSIGGVKANADMAIGNANAQYSLTQAAMDAPSASSVIAADIGGLNGMTSLPSLGK